MKTKSGILIIGKREAEGLRKMIEHSQIDLGYGAEGTFGDGVDFSYKEAHEVSRAIDNLSWILLKFTK